MMARSLCGLTGVRPNDELALPLRVAPARGMDLPMPSNEIDKCPHCGETRTLLTINDAAELARVDRKTIYRWMKKGMLEHCVLPSGLVRIFKDSLIRRSGEGPSHDHPEVNEAENAPASTWAVNDPGAPQSGKRSPRSRVVSR